MYRSMGFTLLMQCCAVLFFFAGCTKQAGSDYQAASAKADNWSVSALPSSVRLDPVSGKVIEDRPDIYDMEPIGNLMESNWVFDGDTVRISAARGEYVSFQLVLSRAGLADTLRDVYIAMTPFAGQGKTIQNGPELFLEWSVPVKSKGSSKNSGLMNGQG